MKVGQSVTLSRAIREEDVEAFARLSLDRNPLHFNEEFAARTVFKKPIAHGLVGAALLSGGLTKLMGSGNLWLSAEIDFEKPVFIGDELRATLTIQEIERRVIARISVSIENGRGEIVLTGMLRSLRTAT